MLQGRLLRLNTSSHNIKYEGYKVEYWVWHIFSQYKIWWLQGRILSLNTSSHNIKYEGYKVEYWVWTHLLTI